MKDIIDLGNLVFNQLIVAHGESEESRLLFLYNITVGEPWTINTNKTIVVSNEGVSISFDDQVIHELNGQWKLLLLSKREAAADAERAKMNSGVNKFKDGDTFEFWQNDNGPWREINF